MIKTILSILIAILLAPNAFADTDNFYNEALKRINKASGRNVRPYLNSAYHVGRMWKKFPDPDLHQRVSINMGWGGKESGFAPDLIHGNIPGKPYPGLRGLKVKRFSVDYGWAGLNEGNVYNTYEVAKAVQSGKTLSRGQLLRMGLHPDLMVKIKPLLKIPKDMDLFPIDVSTAVDARKQYEAQKKAGISPKQIKIDIPYAEDTQDKIDSVLLYRTIEEFDRYLRGWPQGLWDSEAFFICQDIINE